MVFCGFCFLDLGVVDPWYNASYLHGYRSGDNDHVRSFPNWPQCPFGYLLDLDRISGLEQRETDCGLGVQLGLLDGLMRRLYAGLEGL